MDVLNYCTMDHRYIKFKRMVISDEKVTNGWTKGIKGRKDRRQITSDLFFRQRMENAGRQLMTVLIS